MGQELQGIERRVVSRSEVLAILRDHKEGLAEKYGITRLGIFGSFARAENSEISDIDVIVDMPPDFFQMVHLKEELETLLHAPVDLIRYHRNLSDFFKQRLEQEAIYV